MRSSETPVLIAIDESVSPDFTAYVRRLRDARRLLLDERFDVVLLLPVVADFATLEVAAGSSEDSSVAFTTE